MCSSFSSAQVEQVSLPLFSPFDLKHDVALRREIKSPAGDLDSIRSHCSTLFVRGEVERSREKSTEAKRQTTFDRLLFLACLRIQRVVRATSSQDAWLYFFLAGHLTSLIYQGGKLGDTPCLGWKPYNRHSLSLPPSPNTTLRYTLWGTPPPNPPFPPVHIHILGLSRLSLFILHFSQQVLNREA